MDFSSAEVSTYYSIRVPNMGQRGGEWRAPCPIHCGKRESFAVNSENGLWRCHSKCGKGGNILSLEMELSGADFKAAAAQVDRILGRPESAWRNGSTRKKGGLGRVVAEYDYTDEAGNLLFQCVRYTPKDFRQRRPNGNGGYVWNLSKVRLVTYHLPKLLSADTVYVVEGEKDVHSLESMGLVATCLHRRHGRVYKRSRLFCKPVWSLLLATTPTPIGSSFL
jgi:CHC2 zinc finger